MDGCDWKKCGILGCVRGVGASIVKSIVANGFGGTSILRFREGISMFPTELGRSRLRLIPLVGLSGSSDLIKVVRWRLKGETFRGSLGPAVSRMAMVWIKPGSVGGMDVS